MYPDPPWIWTARSAILPTASLAKYFAAEGASRRSVPASYAAAASSTRDLAARYSVCESASMAWMSWYSPIRWPPCERCLA
jgi:hypothetical protein